MRVFLVNMDCSDMILCTLTDAGHGFTLKAQHCLLWWKVNEVYSERTVLFTLVCGAAGLYDSYLRASGSAARLHLQMNPLDRLISFKRPVLAFHSRTIRTADSPAGPHQANAYANAERGLHNTDNLSESPKQSHPENGLLCFLARNQRNGPGAFTWGSVVERWRWRGSGSLCPSHNNNPGRTASSHCEHEDGLEAVIPLVGARGSSHFTPDDGRKRFGAETLLGAHKRIHTDSLSRRTKCRPEALLQEWLPPSAPNQPAATRRLPLPALLPFPPSSIRRFPSSPLSSSTRFSSHSSLLIHAMAF